MSKKAGFFGVILSLLASIVLYGCVKHSTQPSSSPPGTARNAKIPDDAVACQLERVTDGDTLTVQCEQTPYTLRLHCLDAPETQQAPWGERATAYLTKRLSESAQRLYVQRFDTDRYQRHVAVLWLGGENLNQTLVKGGWAAVYPRYCTDSAYYQAQRLARDQRLGIWQTAGLQQTPWQWRYRAP